MDAIDSCGRNARNSSAEILCRWLVISARTSANVQMFHFFRAREAMFLNIKQKHIFKLETSNGKIDEPRHTKKNNQQFHRFLLMTVRPDK